MNKIFEYMYHKKGIQIANKYLEKMHNFIHPVKCKLKPHLINYKFNKMAQMKRWKIPNESKDIEQLVLVYVAEWSLLFPRGKETDSKILT